MLSGSGERVRERERWRGRPRSVWSGEASLRRRLRAAVLGGCRDAEVEEVEEWRW